MELNEVEIKKDLYKSKAVATFSHYCEGKLYYNVDVLGSRYQFPINTVESKNVAVTVSVDDEVKDVVTVSTKKLSTDLGTTPFVNEMVGSHLNRWIAKAIKTGEFIKISR